MKEKDFCYLWVIVRWITLFALVAVLGACAPANIVKPVDVGRDKTINIGILAKETGFYLLVEKNDTKWTIKRISISSLSRTTDSQEVLFINDKFDYVSPAFTSELGKDSKKAFVCPLVSSTKNNYSACGKTKLLITNVKSSLVVGTVATVLTFGLAARHPHVIKVIDRSLLSKILKETDLINVARTVASYLNKIEEYHQMLLQTVKWDVKVQDKLGYTGNIDFTSKISISKFNRNDILDNNYITVNGNNSDFQIALKSALENYKIPMKCPEGTLEENGFGFQFKKCPTHIDSKPVSVKVVVNFKNIQDIKNPSEAVQLLAVKESGENIIYIKNPTEAVQLLAVKESGENIEYIKKPHPSVRNHPNVIAYREEQKIATQKRKAQGSSSSSIAPVK